MARNCLLAREVRGDFVWFLNYVGYRIFVLICICVNISTYIFIVQAF